MKRYNKLKSMLEDKNMQDAMKNIYNTEFDAIDYSKYVFDIFDNKADYQDSLDNGVFSEDYLYDADTNITHQIFTDLMGGDFDNEEDAEFYYDYANEISDLSNDIVYTTINDIKKKI